MQEQKTFRVRTDIGVDGVINVPLEQTFDTIDVLSVKLDQKNAYKLYDCGYGVIIGRVLANDAFGVPNARISIFIPMDEGDDGQRLETLYNFSSVSGRGEDGSMYNLLPDFVDKACHKDVGSFYSKRIVLDNDDVIEVFDKYYKYTTVSNQAGDYMIYGVPTGSHIIHVDIDLSDIGVLSQTPRDMMYKGYPADMFESATKFKKDDNLNTLAQIKRQTKTVYVQPFWGDTSEGEPNASIVRCDISVDYKFEPTCIFMGSVMTDNGSESINKNCRTTKGAGKMQNLVAGTGMIEMIRYNARNEIEQATVKGDKQIDENGVWCYQIPMNLDYVKTDEYGKTVPTDDPNKGVPTRARVRFRISMDDVGGEAVATKRARYLVPNNPELYYDDGGNVDSYQFGSNTNPNDFRDLYWNCVYTVKSYIPRLQKSKHPQDAKYTGIKAVNRSGDNNPMPYNSLSGKMNFNYVMVCLLLKMFVRTVYSVNRILTTIALPALMIYRAIVATARVLSYIPIVSVIAKILCRCKNEEGVVEDVEEDETDLFTSSHICNEGEEPEVGSLCHIFYIMYKAIGCGIGINGLCNDGSTYYPGCINLVYNYFSEETGNENANNRVADLFNCFENRIAEENEVMSFNFVNDWVNGVLYFPLWYRFIKEKKTYLFGLLTSRSKDKWCNGEKGYGYGGMRRLKLYKTCSLNRTCANEDTELNPVEYENVINNVIYDALYAIPGGQIVIIGYGTPRDRSNCFGYRCIKKASSCINNIPGIIRWRETMLGEMVYYYNAGTTENLYPEISSSETEERFVKMFSTDIVLLGSLHDCDLQGIPQFFRNLSSTTYSMPPDMVVNDGEENEDASDSADDDDDSSSPADSFVEGTEYTFQTGADWGKRGYRQCNGPESVWGVASESSPEKFADGGLFYGITCSHIYTKPKTCVNLERICEYGVSPDISLPIVYANGNNVEEKELIADGYISYDDIRDNDGRTEFAVMNSNNLATRINPVTGFPVYDFDASYMDNFDGSLSVIMGQTNCKCGFAPNGHADDMRANYYYNYLLEKNSQAYSKFRYGDEITILGFSTGYYDKKLSATVPFNNGLVSTKNSFYFYFGLKYGKTAIDRFFNDYFSVCDTDETSRSGKITDYSPNSACPGNDGYFSMVSNGIEMPYSVTFVATNDASHDVYVSGIESEKIYFGLCSSCQTNGYRQMVDSNNIPIFLQNDVYRIDIVDANGVTDTIDLDFMGGGMNSDILPVGFVQTNDVIYSGGYTTYSTVSSDATRYSGTPQKGGYIFVGRPRNVSDNTLIGKVRISVKPYSSVTDFPSSHESVTGDSYTGFSFDWTQGTSPTPSGALFGFDAATSSYVIGVPKGGVRYIVTITEMCGTELTWNTYSTIVMVTEPQAIGMTVNGIDYEIIRDFAHNPNSVLQCDGWLDMSNIGVANEIDVEHPSLYTGQQVYAYALSVSKYSSTDTSYYSWSDECLYNMTNFVRNCVFVETLPTVSDSSPYYVFNENDKNIYYKGVSAYALLNYNQYYLTLPMEEKNILLNGILSITENRKRLTRRVRSAFYMTLDNGGMYEMKIGYSGGTPLIRHCIGYGNENANGYPIGTKSYEFNDNIVTGGSPTISGTNAAPSFYSHSGIVKIPYECGVIDSLNVSLPSGFNIVSQTSITSPFFAHMLDKPMDCEYEIWAPATDFPDIEGNIVNEKYSVEGIAGIVVKNGISTSLNNIPDFNVCQINEGVGQTAYLYTLKSNTLTLTEAESRPGTRRVSYHNSGIGRIISYTIDSGAISQTGPKQFYKFDNTFSPSVSFVCSDERENVNVPLYPSYSIPFNRNESRIDFDEVVTNVWRPKLKLAFSPSAYIPSEIRCFFSDNNFKYPLDAFAPINANNSIMKWGNYNVISDSNNANLVGVCNAIDDFTMEYDMTQSDTYTKVFGISISGTSGSNKIRYALSHLLDCTILQINTTITYDLSTDKSHIVFSTGIFGNDGNYVKYYDFTLIGYLNGSQSRSDNVAANGSFNVDAVGDWTTSYVDEIWVMDVSGVKHRVFY